MNLEKSEGKEKLKGQSESFPTLDVILDVISRKLENLSFKIEKELSDDNGVFFVEIMTNEPDAEGYIREYTYSRKSLKTGDELPPKIYVAFFSDGVPVGGEEVHSF
jgi:hypothetical protein